MYAEDEYKGHQMVVLKSDTPDLTARFKEKPMKFGLKKAKLILQHINDIAQFVQREQQVQQQVTVQSVAVPNVVANKVPTLSELF